MKLHSLAAISLTAIFVGTTLTFADAPAPTESAPSPTTSPTPKSKLSKISEEIETARKWAKTDPNAAFAWAASLKDHEEWLAVRRALISDQVNIAKKWAKSDSNAAFAWAETLQDSNERFDVENSIHSEEIDFAKEQMKTDPKAALAWAQSLQNSGNKNFVANDIIRAVAETNFDEAMKMAASLPTKEEQENARNNILADLAGRYPEKTSRIIAAMPRGSYPSSLISLITEWWIKKDEGATVAWIKTLSTEERFYAVKEIAWRNPTKAISYLALLPDEKQRLDVLSFVAEAQFGSKPKLAAELLSHFPNNQPPSSLIIEFAKTWSAKDPKAALAWTETLSGYAKETAVKTIFSSVAETNPAAATALLLQIPTRDEQARVAKDLIPKIADADPQASATLLSALPTTVCTPDLIYRLAASWMKRDPDAARQWATTLPDAAKKNADQIVFTDPRKIDPYFVAASEVLFAQGLPDPSGCEYREITIRMATNLKIGDVLGGCEYREITIRMGNIDPNLNGNPQAETVKTHGWLLPAASAANHDLSDDRDAKNPPQQFAIAWNGCIYPVIAVSGTADIEADARAIIHKDKEVNGTLPFADETEEQRSERQKRFRRSDRFIGGREEDSVLALPLDPDGDIPIPPYVENSKKFGETAYQRDLKQYRELLKRSVKYNSPLTAIRAALLLRFGKTKLAQDAWNEWLSGVELREDLYNHPQPRPPTFNEVYKPMADEWLYALMTQAFNAQQRGDDKVALAAAQKLAQLDVAANHELGMTPAAELSRTPGLERGFGFGPGQDTNRTAFSFLIGIKQFLADQENRAKEATHKRLPLTAIEKISDQKQRIALLIDQLDEVVAENFTHPGGVVFTESPIIRALIAEGKPAVEPLVQCVKNDTRLTRAHYDNFGRWTSPIMIPPVSDAAMATINEILKTNFSVCSEQEMKETVFGSPDPETTATSPAALAEKIEAYLKKYGSFSEADRWYETLANDQATPQQWADAAGNIVHPQSENDHLDRHSKEVLSGNGFMFGGYFESAPMRGESLRTKKNPSVSELLMKRIRDSANHSNPPASLNDFAPPSVTAQLVQALQKWDPKSTREIFAWLDAKLMEKALASDSSVIAIAQLTVLRIRDGDKNALPEYVEFFKKYMSAQKDIFAHGGLEKLIAPLWIYLDNAEAHAALAEVFGDPKSPWSQIFDDPKRWELAKSLVQTPLIAIPEFRAILFKKLADKSVSGTLKKHTDVATDSRFIVTLTTGKFLEQTVDSKNNPDFAARDGATFRVCDLYAHWLAENEGLPACELYWTETRRDAAVTRCIEILKQQGDQYRASPKYDLARGFFQQMGNDPITILSRPPLKHPATSGN